MVYNLTGIMDNSTTVLGFVQGVNDGLMQGWFATLILIALSVIMFMAFVYSTQDTGKALAAASFISFALSVLLRAMNLVPNLAIYITLVMAAIVLAFTWKNG